MWPLRVAAAHHHCRDSTTGSTEAPFLAGLVLPGPKQGIPPSPDTPDWHKGMWKEKCQAVLWETLGDGDGGTKSKEQDSWMLDILPAGSCRGMSNVMAKPLSFLGHVLCLYFHLDLYPRPAPLPVARSSKQFWALQCLLQASSFSGILFAITRILLVLCYGTGMQLSFCEGTKWEGRKVWGSIIRFLMTFPLATLQHMLVVQKNWVRCPICCSLSPRVTNVHIHVFFPCRFLEHQTRSL